MWFRNLQIYRLPAPWDYSADQLATDLSRQMFAPASSNEILRQGWDAPRGAGLVHIVNRQMLIMLATEKKLLPANVVNQVAKAKAAELEEAQGFAPGRKAMKELKERVADELLPRAFSVRTNTFCWIDPVGGWLVVDAASPGKADDVVKMLLKAVDKMPLESLRVQRSPVAVMTAWLETDEAPVGFTVDQDATLQATGESKASVRYVKHALEADDIGRHIAAGKQCKRLAMTWDGKISFVLDETLAIKGVKPLDVLTENAGTRNDEERFDNDMTLMTGELAKMLADIVQALGGEADDLVSKAQPETGERSVPGSARAAVKKLHDSLREDGVSMTISMAGRESVHLGDGPDPLYDQAVAIVLAQRRASISLVQRHLRIGYNRSARLLETMEQRGVVSSMQSNGNREILAPAP